MYFRVFSLRETTPDLAALLEHLHANGLPAIANFRGDDLGWTGGELILGDLSVTVERYLTKEDDLRDELNTWAGWLETRADHLARIDLGVERFGARRGHRQGDVQNSHRCQYDHEQVKQPRSPQRTEVCEGTFAQ